MTRDLSSLVDKAWLDACPTGILVLQGENVLWANAALERMTGITLKDIAGQPAPTHLSASHGLMRVRDGEGAETWAFCETTHLDTEQPIELRFYQDVTGEVQASAQRDLLARRVEELTLTDELTGLANPRALSQSLSTQVTRSRRYHNPLSLAVVRMQADDTDMPLPDGVILSVSRFLRERLRWADIIGRHQADAFMLILPETDREAATRLLESIREEARDLRPPAPHEHITVQLRMGIAQWDKGMDPARLIGDAQQRCADDVAEAPFEG